MCFLANGVSYLAVLAALLAMRLPRRQRSTPSQPLLDGVGEGFVYAWRCEPIRALLLLAAVVSMAAAACMTLLPVVATGALHGDASTFGILTAATGAGALAGSAMLAVRRSVAGLGWWILVMPGVFGVALAAFSFPGVLWIAALFLGVSGFALLVVMAASNTLLQILVDDALRGRVMSLFTMAVTGLAPLGNLAAGVLARRIGTAGTLELSGLACVAGAVVFAAQFARLREQARSMVRTKGLPRENIASLGRTRRSKATMAGTLFKQHDELAGPERRKAQGPQVEGRYTEVLRLADAHGQRDHRRVRADD
jgi:hypothetical protein